MDTGRESADLVGVTHRLSMRLLLLASLLTLSVGAIAQPDPLRSVSFGVGPATGLSGPAAYSELRMDLELSPWLAVRPVMGFAGEAGRVGVAPCLIPPVPGCGSMVDAASMRSSFVWCSAVAGEYLLGCI